MTKTATRLFDPTAHGGLLAPGVGSLNCLIENRPAWRTEVDVHMCMDPVAPPAPAPHAAEKCYLGSFTVLIDGQMAVREGDTLIGVGPPNTFGVGSLTCLIGDVPIGLAEVANIAEFCADMRDLKRDWSSLTPTQRQARLGQIINKQLTKSNVPTVGVNPTNLPPDDAGQFDFSNWNVNVSSSLLNSATLSSTQAQQFADTIYHEARHAEQWHGIVQYRAGLPGATAQGISSDINVPFNVAQQAMASPVSGPTPRTVFGRTMYQSVYGARRNYRSNLFTRLRSTPMPPVAYDQYRALPEEADAWRTANATAGCGC